ncbi:MAG: 16S rRNA (uracil(1498)-N(3))-methyltransferase [Bdellovibrionales bacterium]|nr:16S rRNA (uracil(1498)-N(3))-methyltransferase [Bdellovibrionales bacterium]
MRRYWFNPVDRQDDEIQLHGNLYHHIVEVCRQKVGSRFEMFTEGGQVFLVEILGIQGKTARAGIIETRNLPPLPRPSLHLAISLPKFSTMEAVIEKSVELGVFQVHPFVSEYSFLRKIDRRLKEKAERWKRIVLSASQQSGRGDLMCISEPLALDKVLLNFSRRVQAGGVFPYEGKAPQHLRQALEELKHQHLEELWLFVGSEGGYSTSEVELFKSFGLSPLTMGSQILRVETACLAVVSILKYEWDLMM